jgi:hypothetical protein
MQGFVCILFGALPRGLIRVDDLDSVADAVDDSGV